MDELKKNFGCWFAGRPALVKLPGMLGGVVSTVHVYEAAVVEWFEARSIAFTANVCDPSASDESAAPEVQVTYEPPSSEHSNVAPVGSLELNEKTGTRSVDSTAGFVPIVAVGCTVSTFQVYDAGVGVTFVAASTASTANVCDPSASESDFGVVHVVNDPPSTEHLNVAVPSVDENVKLGLPVFDCSAGLDPMATSGADVSTVHV